MPGQVDVHGEIWRAHEPRPTRGGTARPHHRGQRPHADCRSVRRARARRSSTDGRPDPVPDADHRGRRRPLPDQLDSDPGRVRARRHLPAREAAAAAEGARRRPRLPADRPHRPHQPADGRARRAAAGHHHARQRLGEGQRGRLLPRHRSAAGGRRGRELHVRHVAAGADDAAERAGTGGAGRPARRARSAEPAAADRSSITRPIRGASRCRRWR